MWFPLLLDWEHLIGTHVHGGSIFGVTRGTGRGHIARAILESIALQSMDVLECMKKDSAIAITEMRVDGGAAKNILLMQFQSDVLGIDVVRPQNTESTAMGAAYLAGLGCEIWTSMEELSASLAPQDTFKPSKDKSEMRNKISGWKRAVKAAAYWANDGMKEEKTSES